MTHRTRIGMLAIAALALALAPTMAMAQEPEAARPARIRRR